MPDPEAEARRLRKQFEDWQRDLREQETFWADFLRTWGPSYDELRRQQQAAQAEWHETRQLTERMTFDLAMAKATPAAQPPWWRWLLRPVTPWRGGGRVPAQAPEEENG
jgi:hypothetical protein